MERKRERSPDVMDEKWKKEVYFVERKVLKDNTIELRVNEQVVPDHNIGLLLTRLVNLGECAAHNQILADRDNKTWVVVVSKLVPRDENF